MKMYPILPLLVVALVAVSSTGSSTAAVVWNDTFTGQTSGVPFEDFNGNSTNDWSVAAGVSTSAAVTEGAGNPAPALAINDNSASNQVITTVTMDSFGSFDTANASTPELRLSFDFRVDSYSTTTDSQAVRLILRANNSPANGDNLVIGFARASLADADANTDLALFVGTSSATVSVDATTALGFNSGSAWASGFDFGDYSATASANDTNDQFFHFELTYNYNTGIVLGTATNTTTNDSVSFSRNMNPNLSFSNTTLNDRFLIATAGPLTSTTAYYDNIVFEAVPEPSVFVLSGFGLLLLFSRRNRRRRSLPPPYGCAASGRNSEPGTVGQSKNCHSFASMADFA